MGKSDQDLGSTYRVAVIPAASAGEPSAKIDTVVANPSAASRRSGTRALQPRAG